jgi:streptomycin 6-kinase
VSGQARAGRTLPVEHPYPQTALPARLRDQFLGLHGEGIRPWIDGLPALVRRFGAAWEVELTGTLDGGWSSYVAAGTRRSLPVVLKLAPDAELARAEIAGLALRDGVAVPRLIEADRTAGALLLERIAPGTPVPAGALTAADVAALLQRLHLPAGRAWGARTELEDRLCARWTRRRATDPAVAEGAISATRELARSWSRPVLLHGDFEARNLLRGRGGIVAIDGPAAVGDPGFDLASWTLFEAQGDLADLGPLLEALATALAYPLDRARRWAWLLAADGLYARRHEPGWPPAEIEAAVETVRALEEP